MASATRPATAFAPVSVKCVISEEPVAHMWYWYILRCAYGIKYRIEPASGQIGIVRHIPGSALLLDKNHLHALFRCLLHHGYHNLCVFVLIGIIRIVDIKASYVQKCAAANPAAAKGVESIPVYKE